MEKFNNMQKNELKDTEMEEVTGGSLTDQIIRRQKFQQEKEEQQKKKEQTVFSDDSGAWGSW